MDHGGYILDLGGYILDREGYMLQGRFQKYFHIYEQLFSFQTVTVEVELEEVD